jgi:RNA polymerase sigma-70 factor (ECF subfamily)
MPPLATWFRGSDDVATFFAGGPFSGNFQWRTRPVRANGQPAHVFYCWDPEQQAYVPFALNVLTLRGDRISDITSFITRATDDPDPEVLSRLVDQPFEPRWFDAAFLRFGLPDRLD